MEQEQQYDINLEPFEIICFRAKDLIQGDFETRIGALFTPHKAKVLVSQKYLPLQSHSYGVYAEGTKPEDTYYRIINIQLPFAAEKDSFVVIPSFTFANLITNHEVYDEKYTCKFHFYDLSSDNRRSLRWSPGHFAYVEKTHNTNHSTLIGCGIYLGPMQGEAYFYSGLYDLYHHDINNLEKHLDDIYQKYANDNKGLKDSNNSFFKCLTLWETMRDGLRGQDNITITLQPYTRSGSGGVARDSAQPVVDSYVWLNVSMPGRKRENFQIYYRFKK